MRMLFLHKITIFFPALKNYLCDFKKSKFSRLYILPHSARHHVWFKCLADLVKYTQIKICLRANMEKYKPRITQRSATSWHFRKSTPPMTWTNMDFNLYIQFPGQRGSRQNVDGRDILKSPLKQQQKNVYDLKLKLEGKYVSELVTKASHPCRSE